MDELYFMTTSRLGFRHWSSDNANLAVSLWGDPQVTALFAREPLTAEQVRARLQREIDHEREFGVQYWPFFLLDDGEFVGCCGLKPYDLLNNIYEIGFHLRRKFWRAGYATEAARAVVEYAFSHVRVAALMAGHNPQNTGSRRVLEKLGFEYVRDEYFEPMREMHPLYELRSPVILE